MTTFIPPEPTVVHWQHPDRAPYMGTFDQAVAAFAIPPPPRPMQCNYRRIWNGERFAKMMSGWDLVLYNVIADTDSWPMGDTRVAEDCWYLAGGWEYHLVRPLVCGNWALEVLPIAGWWPGAWPAGGWQSAAWYGSGDDNGWSAGGYDYNWGAYGLPNGYTIPASYEVPALEVHRGLSGASLLPEGGMPGEEMPLAPPNYFTGNAPLSTVSEPSSLVMLLFAFIMTVLLFLRRECL